MLVHATSVSIKGKGILLTGASGAGKSDTALRIIDRGGVLVSDDQTELFVKSGKLWGRPPKAIQGKLEVRYIGLFEIDFVPEVEIALVVELSSDHKYLERLPDPSFHSFLDCSVRVLRLPAYDASLPEKIRLALEGTLIDVGPAQS